MRNITSVISITLLIGCASTTFGAVVTFEGFGPDHSPAPEGAEIASVRKEGVELRFSAEDPVTGEVITPFIAEVGDPRVAFQSTLGEDIPMRESGGPYLAGGNYSLTDGLRRTYDYLFDFSSPVASFGLDLYDYRGDGPHALANLGEDSVELQVFDVAGDQIGSDIYVLPTVRPIEGNVVELGVDVLGISSARLHFNGIEGGTAIDNVRFVVPEPAGFGLACIALMGIVGLGRGRNKAA